jgi:glycosyltransferase involved in cell wall biosynthesis
MELREGKMAGEDVVTTRRTHARHTSGAERGLHESVTQPLDMGALRVSIVVVSHNYADYLIEAVESAIAQTYAYTDVVVVDDGSTDASRDILRGFGERVRLVLKDHGGETSTVNAGFAASVGDIVMFLDSDDVLDRNAAEAVVSAWRAGAAKVQFSLFQIDASGETRSQGFPVYPRGISARSIEAMTRSFGFYPTPPTTGNAYGRTFLAEILPLNTELFPFAPDGALNVVAPLYGDVITLNETLGCYRVHDRNMWASPTLDPERIARWIALGRKEAAFLQVHARRLGLEISARDPLDHSWIYLQRRLAVRKLIPDHPAAAGDRPLVLFMLAYRAAHREEPRVLRRMLKIAWFLATALAPERIAWRLLELVFTSAAEPRRLRGFGRVPTLSRNAEATSRKS